MFRIQGAVLALCLAATPMSLEGQSGLDLSAYVGGAGGNTDGHLAAGIQLRVPVRGMLGVYADVLHLTETPAGCATWEPWSHQCTYDGNNFSGGLSLAPFESERWWGALQLGAGFFRHSDTFEQTPWSASAGVDLGVRLYGPVWLKGAYRRLEIFDQEYEDLLGEHPSLNAVTLGVSVALMQRKTGG